MKRILKRSFCTLSLLLFSLQLFAGPGGQLPLKIVTGEVEQEQLWGPDTAEYRHVVANPERLQRAIDAQERHTDALMKELGARGTAVGWDQNDNPVIKVYIDASSSVAGIPETLDGVPVVVEQTGKLYALNIPCEERESGSCSEQPLQLKASAGQPGPTERHPRPVPIGVSAGHINVTAGTLGCRVSGGCHTYALSNAHVFADGNAGVYGDSILQPGVYDGGVYPDDLIGGLSTSVPIEMSDTAFNKVDAALAAVTASGVDRATPADGYGMPRYQKMNPSVNLNVMKYGRTTRMTYGYIDSINATILVDYKGTNARFVGQIIIKANTVGADFSLPGDSGSLVVASGGNNARRPVGLLFAAGGGITAANPIGDVLSALGVSIDGN